MRISKLLLAAAVSASLASPLARAESGQFNFSGAITTSPCSISGADLDKDINLGVVTVADMENGSSKDGTSIPRSFTMKLENCDISGGANDSIKVTLGGKVSEYGANNFGLNETGRGAYLVVQKDGVPIVPGTATDVQKLVNGDNLLNFTAFIKGAGGTTDIKPGEFTATTTVSLDYE